MDDKGKIIKATDLDNHIRKYCKINDITICDLCGCMFVLAQCFNSIISEFMTEEEFIKKLNKKEYRGRMILNLAPIMDQLAEQINNENIGEEANL